MAAKTSRSFNLHRDYSKSLSLSKVGEPSRSWIPKNHIQEREKKFRRRLCTFSGQREMSRSRAVTTKKCTKKRDASAKLLFWLLNLLLFWRSRCRRRRRILSKDFP